MFNMRVSANAVIVRDNHVLVVEFDDESGVHFNFPGGGIEADETIVDGLRREVKEETCADVDVGRLLLVAEYFPEKYAGKYGPVRKLILFFQCYLKPGSEPRQPEMPDANQVAVRWIPIDELADAPLLPRVGHRIVYLLRHDGSVTFTDQV